MFGSVFVSGEESTKTEQLVKEINVEHGFKLASFTSWVVSEDYRKLLMVFFGKAKPVFAKGGIKLGCRRGESDSWWEKWILALDPANSDSLKVFVRMWREEAHIRGETKA